MTTLQSNAQLLKKFESGSESTISWEKLAIINFNIPKNAKMDSGKSTWKQKKPILTHFSPVSHFYTKWKRQKTKGFLTFSGGIEMWHWTKMGWYIFSICSKNRRSINNTSKFCKLPKFSMKSLHSWAPLTMPMIGG